MTSTLKAIILAVTTAILIGAVGGCTYTWRPYWWNFYERGLSRASEGQHREAAEDFETATGARKGATVPRPTDARRVRTYGLHFVDDYFPHRELGITYYRIKQFADAERELLTSLDQTPSAKAKAYLNLVRTELLRQNPAQDQPPILELKTPSEQYLNADKVTLTGLAHSKNYISSVLVNGRRLFIELAQQQVEFSRELTLKPGANEIAVEAVDLVGMSATKRVVVNVDLEYPAFAIADAVRKGPDIVTLDGIATDNTGVAALVLDGRARPIDHPSKEIDFTLDAPVGDTINVEVSDLAGNKTSAIVHITPDMLQPAGEESLRPVFLAMLESGSVARSDAPGILLSLGEAAGDRTAPIITLRNVADNRVIYADQFIFDGMASDNGRLALLTVNGEDMLRPRTGVLVKYFTYRASLTEGANKFTVVAVDKAGNKAEKSFQVVRKIQEPLQVSARLTLALLPLQKNGDTESAASQIYDLLLGSFLECGRFNLLERDEAVFTALLTELKIGNSQLADRTTAVRIGRMKTAEGMLYGKTIEDHQSITIDLWLVDTETSEILFFADVYGQDKSRDELKWLADGLVLKFRQQFPLVRGNITHVTDAGVFINNGSLDGIWTGMKYLILHDDPEAAPGALTIRKADGRALEARVKSVQERSCFAAFPDKTVATAVKVDDPVITK